MFSAAFKTFVFEVFLRLLATFLVFGSESLSVDLRLRGEHTFAGTEKLQQLVPLVQCDDNSMTLLLQGCRSSSLLVDRADAPPLPLSRLPPSCGFSVKRARRDLLLVAPYDGCHVAREGGRYVLPLRIYGAPLKMSCPVTSSSPPTVSCEDSNMVVKVEGAANEVSLKVRGSWKPLQSVCGYCGCSIVHHGQLLIKVPYTSTCVSNEEAGFTIQLLTMAGETTLSCPPVQAKPTRSVPPVHPIFPPYYPMSFYTLYPTKAPPTLSPVHPKYAYYPIPFPDKYPKAPLSNAPPAKINPRYQFYQMPYSSAPVPRRNLGITNKDLPTTDSIQHTYSRYQFYPMPIPNSSRQNPVGSLGTNKALRNPPNDTYPRSQFYPMPFNSPKLPLQNSNKAPSIPDSIQHIYHGYTLDHMPFPNGYPKVAVGNMDTEAPSTPSNQNTELQHLFQPLPFPNSYPGVPLAVQNVKIPPFTGHSAQHVYPGYPFYRFPLTNNYPKIPVGKLDGSGPNTPDLNYHIYPRYPFYHKASVNNYPKVSPEVELDKMVSHHHTYYTNPFHQMSSENSYSKVSGGEPATSIASTTPSSNRGFPQWYQLPFYFPKSPVTPTPVPPGSDPMMTHPPSYPLFPAYYPVSYKLNHPEIPMFEPITPVPASCGVS